MIFIVIKIYKTVFQNVKAMFKIYGKIMIKIMLLDYLQVEEV